MGSWNYIAERLNGDGTGTIISEDVPLSDVEITDSLSTFNGFNATITPEMLSLKAPDGSPLFKEWGTALYAECDGVIYGGGILTDSTFDGPNWQLECVGFLGYSKDLPYTGAGQYFIKTDTLDIARQIWYHIQTQPGGNIGLEFDTTKSGLLVGSELTAPEYDPAGPPGGLTLQSQAYKLAYYQDHDLSSNFDDLATNTPFDYVERHYRDEVTGQIRHHVEFGVPRIGRRRPELRFVIGENILDRPSITRGGSNYANEVYVLGAGEGSEQIRGGASVARDRLRRVAVRTDSNVRDANVAAAMAGGDLQWRQNLNDLNEIVVFDNPTAPLGSLFVGDEIFIAGSTGWVNADAWYRVLNKTVRPADGTQATLTVARTDVIAS